MARTKKNAAPSGSSTPGDRAREARTKAGLTQQQLADAIGIHVMTVHHVEHGKRRLTADVAMRIAAATNVSPAELLPELPWPK